MITTRISKVYKIWKTIKRGWDETAFIFVIGGTGAIFGTIFGITGTFAIILTFVIFYYIGKFHMKMDETNKRLQELKELQNQTSLPNHYEQPTQANQNKVTK